MFLPVPGSTFQTPFLCKTYTGILILLDCLPIARSWSLFGPEEDGCSEVAVGWVWTIATAPSGGSPFHSSLSLCADHGHRTVEYCPSFEMIHIECSLRSFPYIESLTRL